MPGMMTGIILALSRAMGETAPLIMVGAFQYVPFTPNSIFSQFTVMPVQIYAWTARPQPEFQVTAAAGIVVLLVVLLAMNSIAILLRNRHQGKVRW
jgi:phosphate transport system permease protein